MDRSRKVQRYDIDIFWIGIGNPLLEVDKKEDGEWVRWADVEPALAPLTDEQLGDIMMLVNGYYNAYPSMFASGATEAMAQLKTRIDGVLQGGSR